MHYTCPTCEKQNLSLVGAYWPASQPGVESWTFTCRDCGWEGTSEEGFWGQDGLWNRRSGALNR